MLSTLLTEISLPAHIKDLLYPALYFFFNSLHLLSSASVYNLLYDYFYFLLSVSPIDEKSPEDSNLFHPDALPALNTAICPNV